MLTSVSLKFTEVPHSLNVPTSGVTLFVGSNNSGKSLVLREIEQDFSEYQKIDTKILADYEISWLDENQLNKDILTLQKHAPPNFPQQNVYVWRFDERGCLQTMGVDRENLKNFMSSKTNKRWISSQFLKHFLIRLDGRTRFQLTNDQERGDLLDTPQNLFMHLFQNSEERKKVRDIIFDAFGIYFTIEQLSAQHLRIRFSPTEPDESEQHWSEAARAFHANADYIKDTSDGVQAYVGIVSTLLSGDYRAVLIDEPEAFLHPPLARKLGRQLTANLKSGSCLMASTHSPDFLIGCLQAPPNVRVVRLSYSGGKSKGKIVDSEVLGNFFKKPLFRSANVISSLFHDGVIVTESDNDRAFYSEIYHRLAESEKGFPSILFVNAQNKQTICKIIGPLRTFGIPAAAIVDIDILKDGGQDWTQWLDAAKLPNALHNGLGQIRSSIDKAFSVKNINMKEFGVQGLEDDDRKAAGDLFDHLQQYGIFVVRNGEVESWLKRLEIRSKKSQWTVEMLERMGGDPMNASYVKPEVGDVWDFMRSIVTWVKDSQRKGTD
jgi:predicted ATPase